VEKLELVLKNSTGRGVYLHTSSCLCVLAGEAVCMEILKKIVTW